jgi:uncharacterized damage-inducible protein DinB
MNEQKLVEPLRQSLAELPRVVESLPKDRVHQTPAEGEWSAASVVVHLADSEMVYGVRMRLALTRDRPPLVALDQEVWERRFAALEPVDAALARWAALRESNVRLLESLSSEEWRRSGIHDERGEESVQRMAEILVDHDRQHLDQMRRAATG